MKRGTKKPLHASVNDTPGTRAAFDNLKRSGKTVKVASHYRLAR
jgi:hypothetical protein